MGVHDLDLWAHSVSNWKILTYILIKSTYHHLMFHDDKMAHKWILTIFGQVATLTFNLNIYSILLCLKMPQHSKFGHIPPSAS